MGRKGLQTIILICLIIAGCSKGGDEPQLPNSTGRKAYIICEGSLGNGNSALSLYFPDTDSVFEDVYKSANGIGLGDIFQSMTLVGDQYYLAINNSDRLLAINKTTWKKESMTGVNKPRYVLSVSNDKLYVSSLFSSSIFLVDPKTGTNYGSIVMPYKSPEGMLRLGKEAYIACWDTACSKLFSYNTETDLATASIELGTRAPQEMLQDKDGMLWVLSGNVVKGKTAALTRIDPTTKTVLKTYTFPTTADPIRPVFNATKDTLYFIEVNYSGGVSNNGVYRMNIQDASLPATAFIQAQNLQYFWALGVDPVTGYIYVGDPKGFTQRGQVYIYKQNGTQVKSFKVGVGPGHFLFD